jgi:hypothetical protein
MRKPFLSDYLTSDFRLLPQGIKFAIHFWRRLPIETSYLQEFRRLAIYERRDTQFWWGKPEIKSDWVACEYPGPNSRDSSEPEDYQGLLADESGIELIRQEGLFRDGYALFQFKDISDCCLCFCSIREDRHKQIIVQLGPALVAETHRKVEELLSRELEHQNIDSKPFIDASDLCRSWFCGRGSPDDSEIPRFRAWKTIPDILQNVEFKHAGWPGEMKTIKAADASLRKLIARLPTEIVKQSEPQTNGPKPPGGMIADLDIAIKAGENAAERIPEWPIVRHFLRERFPIHFRIATAEELWTRCTDWIQAIGGLNGGEYLSQPIAQLIEWLEHGFGGRDVSDVPQPPNPDAIAGTEGGSVVGFLGANELAQKLNVHSTRIDAFTKALSRERIGLGDGDWHEVRDPRPNCPSFLYRVDSQKVRELAAKYQTPKPT